MSMCDFHFQIESQDTFLEIPIKKYYSCSNFQFKYCSGGIGLSCIIEQTSAMSDTVPFVIKFVFRRQHHFTLV